MRFDGKISGLDVVRGLLAGAKPGKVKVAPSGAIQTLYGDVKLPEKGFSVGMDVVD